MRADSAAGGTAYRATAGWHGKTWKSSIVASCNNWTWQAGNQRSQSSRWQTAASLPEKDFEHTLPRGAT